MSDLIQFPQKVTQKPKAKTPEETLEYVLDGLRSGNTRATKMIVAWAYEDEEQVEYRFITGGQDSDLSTLGIIEMTKSMVLEG